MRERFLTQNTEAFASYELLELLLFYSIERVDVKPLAKELLRDFKSLGGVIAADPGQLAKHKRVNDRTIVLFKAVREAARRLLQSEIAEGPVLSSWTKLIEYCCVGLADESTERFRVLYLNRKNKLIADEIQQSGTVDHAPVYPREVIKRALELGATALILVHNHPSGDPTPSTADVAMTREIRDAAEKLGIALYDHVVVAKGGAASLKALGLI